MASLLPAPMAAPAATPLPAAPASPLREALAMFCRNPSAVIGMLLLGLIVATTVAGPWLVPADPFEMVAAPLTPPGTAEAWLGSDQLGRDVAIGLLHGGRATLLVGAVAALLSVGIGITLGALAGYRRRPHRCAADGRADRVLPGPAGILLFAIALMALSPAPAW